MRISLILRSSARAGMAGLLAAWLPATPPLPERVTLEQAVAEATAANPALLAERANTDIAAARVWTARLRPNPTVTLSGDHLDLLGSGFNDANGGGPSEAVVGFEFVHERGGKRQSRVAVAAAARSVAELQFQNAGRSLALDVQNAFVDALVARDGLQLARQNSGFLKQIVEINEARVKAGDLPEVDLIRSRLAALQYETSVRQAEIRQRNALARLQTLMGRRRPSAAFEIIGDLDRPDAAPLLEDLQRAANENRPDLRGLRRDVERAGAEIRLQRANARQDVTLGTEYRRQQVNARANAVSIAISAPLPVFNRNQGEIERARQEQRQAELKVRALENEIAGQLETVYQQFLAARDLLKTIGGAMLQQARDVREITGFSYRRGDASLLALLDSQRAFNDTMQGYIEARAEYARSLYLLDYLSGKGAGR